MALTTLRCSTADEDLCAHTLVHTGPSVNGVL